MAFKKNSTRIQPTDSPSSNGDEVRFAQRLRASVLVSSLYSPFLRSCQSSCLYTTQPHVLSQNIADACTSAISAERPASVAPSSAQPSAAPCAELCADRTYEPF